MAKAYARDPKTGDLIELHGVHIYEHGEPPAPLQPLTFTGAVEASYDGTEAVSVNIEALPPIDPEDEGKVLTAEGGKAVWKKGGGIPSKNYRIDYKLTKVSSSNRETSVAENAPYTTTLTADEGLGLSGVSITMGGKNVTVNAWKEPAVTIKSVTGDVVITAEGVGAFDTSPKIAKENAGYDDAGTLVPKEGLSATIDYSFSVDKEILKKYPNAYDPVTDVAKVTGWASINIKTPKAKGLAHGYDLNTGMTNSRSSIKRNGAAVQQPANNCLARDDETTVFKFDRGGTDITNANSISIVISTLDADDSYAYWVGQSYITQGELPIIGHRSGDIIFAGKNTPYYGLKNIDGETIGPAPQSKTQSPVMMSFDRVYIDTGFYTPNMEAKWDGMFSIHRGYSTAHDNTLQAFLEAKKHGYNCCEMDLRKTSDGVYVLSHDPSITGTVKGVPTTYVVADTPWATLKELVIGNSKYPDSRIPSMEETFAFCRRIGMRAEIDYKLSDPESHTAMVEMSKRYGMQDDTLHCCYSIDLALTVKNAYGKASLRVGGSLLDDDHRLDAWLDKPGNLYAYYGATMCGKSGGSNAGNNVSNENRIPLHKKQGYKMYVWNVTPFLLPDVMQWEPDVLQPQSGKDGTDWYQSIRELNNFPGVAW